MVIRTTAVASFVQERTTMSSKFLGLVCASLPFPQVVFDEVAASYWPRYASEMVKNPALGPSAGVLTKHLLRSEYYTTFTQLLSTGNDWALDAMLHSEPVDFTLSIAGQIISDDRQSVSLRDATARWAGRGDLVGTFKEPTGGDMNRQSGWRIPPPRTTLRATEIDWDMVVRGFEAFSATGLAFLRLPLDNVFGVGRSPASLKCWMTFLSLAERSSNVALGDVVATAKRLALAAAKEQGS